MTLRQLKRIRWGVRAVLTLGVAASTVANILHADPNPISQTIAAWPPLALLLTVELISRIPVHRRGLAAVRLVATSTIAGIAAWVSYWHMVGVAQRYGETGAAPYLLPLSVDGLVIVASVSLVELAGRIRAATEPLEVTATADVDDVPDPWAYATPIGDRAATVSATTPLEAVAPPTMGPASEPASVADTVPATEPPAAPPRKRTAPAKQTVSKPANDTASKVARWAARMPGATHAEVAAKAGVSVRSVERYRPAREAATTTASEPATVPADTRTPELAQTV